MTWPTIRNMARDYGWLLAIVVSLGSLGIMTAIYTASPEAASTVGIDTGDEIKVIAREPAVAFDVKMFCDDPTTKVGKTVMTDAPLGGVRYIASRGTESVNWADSPEGKNPSAMHYVTAPDGRQHTEAVEVSKAAADCLKRKSK